MNISPTSLMSFPSIQYIVYYFRVENVTLKLSLQTQLGFSWLDFLSIEFKVDGKSRVCGADATKMIAASFKTQSHSFCWLLNFIDVELKIFSENLNLKL